MKFFKVLSSNKGLTLIEVLVSLTILRLILLGIMNFFNQAYSVTNSNQKKTAAINVARNALTYMEQSSGNNSFIALRDRLEKNPATEGTLRICDNSYQVFWNDEVQGCEPITINNVAYNVTIVPSLDENNTAYFIPLTVEVAWTVKQHDYTTSMEGAIKSEDLR